jgi:hypothetical protein
MDDLKIRVRVMLLAVDDASCFTETARMKIVSNEFLSSLQASLSVIAISLKNQQTDRGSSYLYGIEVLVMMMACSTNIYARMATGAGFIDIGQ